MKLLRYGPRGQEKPALLDAQGQAASRASGCSSRRSMPGTRR
jgi:hypothetical protein